MATETITTVVPAPVERPRGAVWAAAAAAWGWHALRDLRRRLQPAPYTRLAHLRTKWAIGGRCLGMR